MRPPAHLHNHPPAGALPSGVRRVVAAVAVVTVVGAVAGGCGTSTVATGSTRSDRATTDGVATATATERLAALRTMATFRDDIGNASAAFANDLTRLQSDLQAANVPGARTDELAAQAEFDQFRQLAGGDPINAETIDELASDVAPGQSFGGLHAVERDLWEPAPAGSSGGIGAPGGDVTQAMADVSGLMAQAPVAEYLLSKDSVAPEAIGVTGVDDLNWLDDVAVPEREELYSHLDGVDISAATAAAHDAFVTITPLAAMVAPTLTTTVAQRFAALLSQVGALGAPTEMVDAALPQASLSSISQQTDATAAGLAELSARLAPFGTGGGPS